MDGGFGHFGPGGGGGGGGFGGPDAFGHAAGGGGGGWGGAADHQWGGGGGGGGADQWGAGGGGWGGPGHAPMPGGGDPSWGGHAPQHSGAGWGGAPGAYDHAPQHGAGYGAQMQPGTFGNFNLQEQEHYHQLWQQVDPHGTGYVDGATAAGFLTTSGLPQDVLHRIWSISDPHSTGHLTMDRFFVACRLVAHAQAGQQPSPELEAHEPQMLPELELQRQRAPSETSLQGSPKGGSEASDMLPVIQTGEETTASAAQAVRRSGSRSPRAFTQERWAPSRRELRKYATLFKKTDWDEDGYVVGADATELLGRSGLSHEVLDAAWQHSDRDQDGRLSFPEFVCLVHLVTCALRGARVPQLHEPLPSDLVRALQNLDPLDVLCAEREASRSRSASPSPHASGHVTPRDAFAADDAFGGLGGSPSADPLAASGDGFGLPLDDDKVDGFGGGDEFGGLSPTEDVHQFDDVFAAHAEPEHHGTSFAQHLPGADASAETHFETVIAINQQISEQLRREVDDLHEEMKEITEVRGRLQREIQEEQQDECRYAGRRASILAQLEDAKARLTVQQDQRRKLSAASLSLRRDSGSVAETLRYLQLLAEDEEQTVQVLRNTNQHLERSFRSLEANTGVLQQHCKELAMELRAEKDAKTQAAQSNADFIEKLGQLKQDRGSLADKVSSALADSGGAGRGLRASAGPALPVGGARVPVSHPSGV